MSLIQCPSCNAQVSNDARTCPHCGKMLLKNVFLGSWQSFIISIALISVGYGLGYHAYKLDSEFINNDYVIRYYSTGNGIGRYYDYHSFRHHPLYHIEDKCGSILFIVGIVLLLISLGVWIYRTYRRFK